MKLIFLSLILTLLVIFSEAVNEGSKKVLVNANAAARHIIIKKRLQKRSTCCAEYEKFKVKDCCRGGIPDVFTKTFQERFTSDDKGIFRNYVLCDYEEKYNKEWSVNIRSAITKRSLGKRICIFHDLFNSLKALDVNTCEINYDVMQEEILKNIKSEQKWPAIIKNASDEAKTFYSVEKYYKIQSQKQKQNNVDITCCLGPFLYYQVIQRIAHLNCPRVRSTKECKDALKKSLTCGPVKIIRPAIATNVTSSTSTTTSSSSTASTSSTSTSSSSTDSTSSTSTSSSSTDSTTPSTTSTTTPSTTSTSTTITSTTTDTTTTTTTANPSG